MAVDIHEQIALWADGLANGVGAGDSELSEVLDLRGVGEIVRHVVEGRELDGVKSSGNSALGHGRKAFRRARISGAVDVGVVAELGVEESAKQFVSGDRSDFATNVPEALLKAAQGNGRSAGTAL